MKVIESYKTCTKCLKSMTLDKNNFYADKNTKDGFTAWCKECKKEYQNNYLDTNRKDINIRKKKSRLKNKEKSKMMIKRWTEENLDRWKDYNKLWRQSEFGRSRMNFHGRNRNKHKKHEITQKEWDACRLYFNYRCAYCGIPYEEHFKYFKQDLHKEHVIIDGRNDLKNCIPSCRLCNSEKHETSLNNWFNPTTNINYTRERYLKIYKWLRYDVGKYIEKKKLKKNKVNKI